MAETKIVDIVSSLLSGVRGITKSETVVGAPQKAGDATVIPVHRVKIAFGAASANAGAHGARLGGDSGAHGAGGAVELDPVAAIAIGKDGQAHLLTVEGDEKSAWSALLQEVPDLLARIAESVGDRVRHELGARGAPAESLPAAEQEAAPAPALREAGKAEP
jgi:uncharacterized spore protein YtfJ